MILRRLATSIRKRDWFTVFVETMIVVLGVFLGLQVQQWAGERVRKATEAEYIARLHDEVADLQATRAPHPARIGSDPCNLVLPFSFWIKVISM